MDYFHKRLDKLLKRARRHCPPYDVTHVSNLTFKFTKLPKYVVTRLGETTLRLKKWFLCFTARHFDKVLGRTLTKRAPRECDYKPSAKQFEVPCAIVAT
ncbi:hypothetical protein AVEN_17533-1 [Araneus ventricosus]|uniref:Uncharacterized protein n=1 Tax=Araneus ventricosus TaxID=182803 RepID=A0A4Y2HF71_ARAVE|nr:hypothetical protein AVEN_17533-1 [Araneus ventricosus]